MDRGGRHILNRLILPLTYQTTPSSIKDDAVAAEYEVDTSKLPALVFLQGGTIQSHVLARFVKGILP